VTRVAFFGGNGHCTARLYAARRASPLLEIADVQYPGFEGRPRAASLEAFLDGAARQVAAPALVYATGIGGLVVLALRARGALMGMPVVLQAPVLWGLERRWMPRLMRLRLAQRALRRVFASRHFQDHFVRRHFVCPPSPGTREAFFAGYASCAALPDLFAWFSPALLRSLEAVFAAHPSALECVNVWWGGRDRVVAPGELRGAEAALAVCWPLRLFPDWGHYPMIDAPEAWIAAVGDRLSEAAQPAVDRARPRG